MIDLYKNIKQLRELHGMSQDDLAKLTGYTNRSSIAKIEKGEVDLPRSKIIAFAKALKTSPMALMGWLDTADENKPIKDKLTRFKANTYEALVIKEMQKMNKAGKVKLLDTARDMNCSPLYNDDYEIELKAAHERTDIEVTDEMRKHDDDIMSDDNF